MLGRPFTVCDEPEMTAIGAALLGGLRVRLWPDFATAVSGLELSTRIIRPNPQWQAVYGDLYGSVYRGLHRTLAGTNRALTGFRTAAWRLSAFLRIAETLSRMSLLWGTVIWRLNFLDHRNGSIWPTTSKCGQQGPGRPGFEAKPAFRMSIQGSRRSGRPGSSSGQETGCRSRRYRRFRA